MPKKEQKSAVEAAQELIAKQHQADIDNCVKELQELQKKENEILKKYGCAKNIKGEFLNNNLQCGFIITKQK